MTPVDQADADAVFIDVFLSPIRKCASYTPAFGQETGGAGLTLPEFRALYGGDSFYTWLGLDDPLLYAAHKAAGGLTSVYRQIGVGSERLFRAVLTRSLGLSEVQLLWAYDYAVAPATNIHKLDARILVADVDAKVRARVADWLARAKTAVGSSTDGFTVLNGVVFEVRQGYKSADSKRQSADLRFGVFAYQSGLLPAFAIMSAQVSEPVIRRYRSDGMLVLTGLLNDDPTISTLPSFVTWLATTWPGFSSGTARFSNGDPRDY